MPLHFPTLLQTIWSLISHPSDTHGTSVSRSTAWSTSLLLLAFMWLYLHPAFQDRVVPIGDTLDYQIIAVNFAQCNEFPCSNMLLPDTSYHFDTRTALDAQRVKERKLQTGPGYNFVRNPLYTLFCGAVYKACGVNVRSLYTIQFFVLILSLSLLPVAGWRVAGQRGIWAGGMAALVIFFLDKYFAAEIQTQALVLPYTIGLWWLMASRLQRKDIASIIFMAVYIGAGLLLKNFFIPVAWLISFYYLWRHQRWQSWLLPLMILVTIVPWSIYANQLTAQGADAFLLTTQGDDVLLASNNDAATDGDWHPEGPARTAYYRQPDIARLSPAMQVAGYMTMHPVQAVTMLSEKVRRGLLTRWPPVLFIVLLWTTALVAALPSGWRFMWVVVTSLIATAVIVFYGVDRSSFYTFQRQADTLLYITRLPLVMLVATAILCIRLSNRALLTMPSATWTLVVSFILLNMVFYGSPRIIGMIDFLWMFYAVMLAYRIRDLLAE